MRTRALTQGEADALRLARLVAMDAMPYWSRALLAMTPLAAPGLATFAVDRAWRLYLDPELLVGESAWSPRVVGAVLCHEIGHLLRDHAGRADAMDAPLVHTAWNYAGDAEINDDLVAAGVELPEGCVLPETLGCAEGDIAENYYRALCDPSHSMHEEASAAVGMDDPGCGSGSGCTAVAAEIGDTEGRVDSDTPAGLSDAAAERVRTLTATDTVEFDEAGRGTVPASITRWAKDALTPAPIPWQTILAATLRRCVGDAAGRVNYTYRRPSRRSLPRIIRPAMRQPTVTVAVVVDTSGSMSQSQVDEAVGQVHRVARTSGVSGASVQMIACDAAAADVQRVTGAGAVALAGGGGTDMRVGIDAALELSPRPDVIVVLTDGYTPWPTVAIPARLVCGLIAADPTGLPEIPEWALRVHIPTGESA